MYGLWPGRASRRVNYHFSLTSKPNIMEKKRLIKVLGKTATVFGLIAIGYALRTVGAGKTLAQQQQELDLLWQYHVNTEDLLDSICAQETNWFIDVLCEQDIYDKYNQTASEVKKMYE